MLKNDNPGRCALSRPTALLAGALLAVAFLASAAAQSTAPSSSDTSSASSASANKSSMHIPGLTSESPPIPGWLLGLFVLLGVFVILSGFLFFRWARQRL